MNIDPNYYQYHQQSGIVTLIALLSLPIIAACLLLLYNQHRRDHHEQPEQPPTLPPPPPDKIDLSVRTLQPQPPTLPPPPPRTTIRNQGSGQLNPRARAQIDALLARLDRAGWSEHVDEHGKWDR